MERDVLARAMLAADSGISAIDRLETEDRALALRAGVAVARRALTFAGPRPRNFVNTHEQEAWSDENAGVVDEAIALVEAVARAIEAGDPEAERDLVARGPALLARTESLEEAIGNAADAFDYDQGAIVVGVVSALLMALAEKGRLGHVVWRAAWIIDCPEEASLPREPRVWDRRRGLRERALRRLVADVVRGA